MLYFLGISKVYLSDKIVNLFEESSSGLSSYLHERNS